MPAGRASRRCSPRWPGWSDRTRWSAGRSPAFRSGAVASVPQFPRTTGATVADELRRHAGSEPGPTRSSARRSSSRRWPGSAHRARRADAGEPLPRRAAAGGAGPRAGADPPRRAAAAARRADRAPGRRRPALVADVLLRPARHRDDRAGHPRPPARRPRRPHRRPPRPPHPGFRCTNAVRGTRLRSSRSAKVTKRRGGDRAAPVRGALAKAVLAGSLSSGAGIALTAVSGWLIVRAAEMPPVLTLMVAIVGVRFFGLGRAVLRWVERMTAHDAALRLAAATRVRLWTALARAGAGGRPDARLRAGPGGRGRRRRAGPHRAGAAADAGRGHGHRRHRRGARRWSTRRPPARWALVLAVTVALVLLVHRHVDAGRGPRRERAAGGGPAGDDDAARGRARPAGARPGRPRGRRPRRAGRPARPVGPHRRPRGGAEQRAGRRSAPGWPPCWPPPSAAARAWPGRRSPCWRSRRSRWPSRSPAWSPRSSGGARWPTRRADWTPSSPRPVPGGPGRAAARAGAGHRGWRVDDLTAGWPGGPDVLRGLTARAGAGDGWLVVRGPSGAGKSTLLAVLMASLRPRGGQLRRWTASRPQAVAGDDLRTRMAWLPQEAHVFASTIRANLALAAPRGELTGTDGEDGCARRWPRPGSAPAGLAARRAGHPGRRGRHVAVGRGAAPAGRGPRAAGRPGRRPARRADRAPGRADRRRAGARPAGRAGRPGRRLRDPRRPRGARATPSSGCGRGAVPATV